MSLKRDRRAWRADLEHVEDLDVKDDVPLAAKTSFKIGGPAELFVQASSVTAVRAVVALAAADEVPLCIFGSASNLLIADRGIPGIVLSLGAGFDTIRPQPAPADVVVWDVGAASSTAKTLRRAVREGLAGLEMMAGIPGTVGGALVMNAGGREGFIESAVREMQVLRGTELVSLGHDEVGFGYRETRLPAGAVVLSAALTHRRVDAAELAHRVQAATERRSRTQPLTLPSAGSVFKNPAEVPAGKLIEAAGCKGLREGGAEVSEIHANFIVNRGGATAGDVLRLIRRVRERVFETSGTRLELEIELVGDFDREEQP